MLTNDIQKKCNELLDKHKENRKFLKPAQILGIFFALFGLSFLTIVGEEYENFQYTEELSIVLGILTLLTLTLAFILYGISGKYALTENEYVAMYAYNSYQILNDYHHHSKFEPKLKKAKTELQKMSNACTKHWSKVSSGDSFIGKNVKDLSSFMKNIEEIPSVIDNKDELHNFQELFLISIMKFSLDYGEDTFESLNKKLNQFVTLPEIEYIDREYLRKFIKEHPMIKYVVVPPLTVVIVFGVLNSVDSTATHSSLATALVIGSAALFGILFRGKFTNS